MNACISNQLCASNPLCAPRRSVTATVALAAIVGACCVMGSAPAQAAVTTGRVFGQAPAGATVVVSSADYGIQRKTVANADGRYLVTWLPIGVYAVTVLDNGEPVVKHPGVQLFVDHGSRVDFACPYGRCAEVAAN